MMLSLYPVHLLNADFQFTKAVSAASVAEEAGGLVIGSITDNDRINQNYCKKFNCITN